MSMEFWGVEVKAGQPLKVIPDEGRVIHISQAALGEGKKEKGNESIPLRLNINGEKFVVGLLSGENFPQVPFDLVLEKEFELSHDWKNGSVYFCGYSADNPSIEDDDRYFSEDTDEDEDILQGKDEDIPQGITDNGKIESKDGGAKSSANKGKAGKPEPSAKPKVTVVEPKKDDESDEDESDDKDMMEASDDTGDSEDEDDSDDSDDSEDEDEETPKKADPGQKRPAESATKTPVPAKKAKLGTPQKTDADGKKGGGHTATPHPSKKAGKTPANSNKSKEQTPKSDAKVTCKTCSKTFNSEVGLQSHTKAKHGGN